MTGGFLFYNFSELWYYTHMKKIPIKYKNIIYYALVDDEDYNKLSKYKWHYERGYARRSQYIGGGRKNTKIKHIRMHQDILGKAEHIDHINHNGLDNRKENLRKCTRSQNFANRKKYANNKSGYKGVSKHGDKWQADIQINGKGKYLGIFKTKEEAAIAYNTAAKSLFGKFAYLNVIDKSRTQQVQLGR
jgi:hypothetical protein